MFCLCGCGTEIGNKRTDGKPKFYAHGHNRRGQKHPNYIPKLGENHGRWKGGRIVHVGGYILIHKPEHPQANSKGYVLEHRLVMEKYLGRYLEDKEIVHHINEDRTDNRIQNLMLLANKAEHAKIHQPLKNYKR